MTYVYLHSALIEASKQVSLWLRSYETKSRNWDGRSLVGVATRSTGTDAYPVRSGQLVLVSTRPSHLAGFGNLFVTGSPLNFW